MNKSAMRRLKRKGPVLIAILFVLIIASLIGSVMKQKEEMQSKIKSVTVNDKNIQ